MRRACLLLALLVAPAGAADDPEWSAGGSIFRLAARAKSGSMPWGISVSADGTRVYVAMVGYAGRLNVWRYDAASLEVKATARFPGHAVETALAADASTLWVTNSRKDELLALDGGTLKVTSRRKTGRTPKAIALTPDGKEVWVTNFGGRTLSAFPTAGGKPRTITVGPNPRGVRFTHDGKKAYVGNLGARTVSVVDVASGKETRQIKACARPAHLAVTRDDAMVLATCYGGAEIAVIDARKDELVRLVKVGKGPNPIAITADQELALVGDEFSDSLSVVDLDTWEVVTAKLPVDRPVGLTIAPDDRTIYLTGRGAGELLVIERTPAAGAR